MRRLISVSLAILVLFVLGTSMALAKDPQIPTLQTSDRGWTDTTGTVSSSTLSSLRDQSARINGEGFQLAGAFFKDIDSDPAQFATNFGNQNGIGYADKDNGLAIIVLLDRAGTDGHKPYIFVATGRGMEGLLNDAKVTEYRNKYFNPLRAQGKWEEGLVQLSTAFADFLGSQTAQEFRTNPNSSQSIPGSVLVIGSILLVLIVVGSAVVVYYFFFHTSGESTEEPETYPEPAYVPVEPPMDDSFVDPVPTKHRRRRKAAMDDPTYDSSPSTQPEPDDGAAEEERRKARKRQEEEDQEEEESSRHREEEDDSSSFGSSSSSFGGGFGGGGGTFGGGGSGG